MNKQININIQYLSFAWHRPLSSFPWPSHHLSIENPSFSIKIPSFLIEKYIIFDRKVHHFRSKIHPFSIENPSFSVRARTTKSIRFMQTIKRTRPPGCLGRLWPLRGRAGFVLYKFIVFKYKFIVFSVKSIVVSRHLPGYATLGRSSGTESPTLNCKIIGHVSTQNHHFSGGILFILTAFSVEDSVTFAYMILPALPGSAAVRWNIYIYRERNAYIYK